MNRNPEDAARAEARAYVEKRVALRRSVLANLAIEAGVKLGPAAVRAVDGRIEGWWPELAPLSKAEREEVRADVAAVLCELAGVDTEPDAEPRKAG